MYECINQNCIYIYVCVTFEYKFNTINVFFFFEFLPTFEKIIVMTYNYVKYEKCSLLMTPF